MLTLTTELSSILLHHHNNNLHLLLALTAFLPTLILARTWFKAISLAVTLFRTPREFSNQRAVFHVW